MKTQSSLEVPRQVCIHDPSYQSLYLSVCVKHFQHLSIVCMLARNRHATTAVTIAADAVFFFFGLFLRSIPNVCVFVLIMPDVPH